MSLTIRSTVAYADCDEYTNIKAEMGGYTGTAIVTCARILARDKLDRMLIDSETYQYFIERFFGIENLPSFDTDGMTHLFYKYYDTHPEVEKQHEIISNLLQPIRSPLNERNNGFLECRTHKIGYLKSKQTELDIYNVEIKTILSTIEIIDVLKHVYRKEYGDAIPGLIDETKTYPEYIISTIGNLNTFGLGDTQLKTE